jgi:hypothetical protein
LKIFLARYRKKAVAVVISLHKMDARRMLVEQTKWAAAQADAIDLAQIGYAPKNAKSEIVLQAR